MAAEFSGTEVRKAAVLGSPIAHSRSPQLHLAAYRALGLPWTYDRIECTAEQLPGLVDGLGPEWVGLSVTMPGKEAALAYATERTERAELVGSANTLLRIDGGWRADCTDVDGVLGALRGGGVEALSEAVVLGAGGTARPALLALAELGATAVTIVARDAGRAASAVDLAHRLGLTATVIGFDPAAVGAAAARSGAAVSTVPPAAAAVVADAVAAVPVVLDAIYNPWPTPLAQAVVRAGQTVVSGLDMLINQAYGQVEQFTGRPAPREAMAAALDSVR
ncbi:shikimate dehydrogenase [Nocardia cyriacigeorgica]|uniref:shikimate dehydrogenase n=1 Tax=Nocardia cyriacigeorgica TaxID=135487 RepID=UPI00189516E2|nr:shikimate dehydrogenase [Nocardia cyriacigeorgica]MBF6096889.1 shikimate dehydrogenase [Nocardia cyriacigeorgica]MBF6158364.1 shikimate dehydrogenase [Nocardia cyriacigeorgica]MBF6197947.1 shikimate dehydrogenase [Nocardia cyriacigeorgica]MBF6316807.1 shikimate dehydrogenase [Nocardia cyriacigeorgica]MBF6513787.1 shikimate dehydrogenase [Nocardia cyriacigeorgica]